MTALQQITARARQLKKKKPGAKWVNLVKQASKEYNAGSLGKSSTRQTGRSNKRKDSQRKAKAPGKRKSASGNTYIERRKNRSDAPGKLTGVSAGSLKGELVRRKKDELGRLLLQRDLQTGVVKKRKLSKKITAKRSELKRLM